MKILVLLLALFIVPAYAAERPVLRILPVGDSLTEGGYNINGEWKVAGGYRSPLKIYLNMMGVKSDFLGRRKSGPVPGGDLEHEGYSGWRIDEVAPKALEAVELFQPDVVLLMLGSNDLFKEHGIAQAPDRLLKLVTDLLSRRPRLVIFVAAPIGTNNSVFNERLKAYRFALHHYVTQLSDPRVIFVDQFYDSRLTLMDFTDGVHPTSVGNIKIARVWAAALAKQFH